MWLGSCCWCGYCCWLLCQLGEGSWAACPAGPNLLRAYRWIAWFLPHRSCVKAHVGVWASWCTWRPAPRPCYCGPLSSSSGSSSALKSCRGLLGEVWLLPLLLLVCTLLLGWLHPPCRPHHTACHIHPLLHHNLCVGPRARPSLTSHQPSQTGHRLRQTGLLCGRLTWQGRPGSGRPAAAFSCWLGISPAGSQGLGGWPWGWHGEGTCCPAAALAITATGRVRGWAGRCKQLLQIPVSMRSMLSSVLKQEGAVKMMVCRCGGVVWAIVAGTCDRQRGAPTFVDAAT